MVKFVGFLVAVFVFSFCCAGLVGAADAAVLGGGLPPVGAWVLAAILVAAQFRGQSWPRLPTSGATVACNGVDDDCDGTLGAVTDLTNEARLIMDQELLEIDGTWVLCATFIHNNGEEVVVVD